jgi:2-oxoglutarate ferredoxin oxidoreductase subunit beta
VAEVGVEALVVHDAHRPDPTYAFGLSRLTASGMLNQSPIGVFRDVAAPAYDDLSRAQVSKAAAQNSDDDALQALIAGNDTWNVS